LDTWDRQSWSAFNPSFAAASFGLLGVLRNLDGRDEIMKKKPFFTPRLAATNMPWLNPSWSAACRGMSALFPIVHRYIWLAAIMIFRWCNFYFGRLIQQMPHSQIVLAELGSTSHVSTSQIPKSSKNF
jgi:hypothetical protein